MAPRQNGRIEATLSIGRRDDQRHGAGGGGRRRVSIAMHHLYLLSIKSSVSFVPKSTGIESLVVVVVVVEWISFWERVSCRKTRDNGHKSFSISICYSVVLVVDKQYPYY